MLRSTSVKGQNERSQNMKKYSNEKSNPAYLQLYSVCSTLARSAWPGSALLLLLVAPLALVIFGARTNAMALRPNVFGIAVVVNDGGDAAELFAGAGQCSTACAPRT